MKNVLLKWITVTYLFCFSFLGISLMLNWDMYGLVIRLRCPISLFLLKSRAVWWKLKIQNNQNIKVQLMQTNNWLGNNYHLSMFSFLFFSLFLFLYFFVCFAFNDRNWNASCSGSQLGFEIATIQICPKRYKNIQTVRLVLMLRLVKQCKIEQK